MLAVMVRCKQDGQARRRLILAGALAMLAGSAGAQSPPTEYKLDGQGQWATTKAPAAGSDEEQIARARKALAEDRPDEAQSILDAYIDKYEKTSNPLLPQAYLYRGDAISAGGNEFKALYDYELVIKDYPQAPEYTLAIERELEIAFQYVNGLQRRFLGVRFVDASDIGTELLIRVQERLPSSRLAERAGIELADFYYRERDMRLASEAYDLFLQNYPNSQYRMKAMERRVYASIARYKGPLYDGKPLADSQVLIRRFRLQYPQQAQRSGIDEALLTRIDESGATHLLETAEWYLGKSDMVSARYTLRRLIARHPQTSAAARALEICQARGWTPPEATGDKPDADLAPPGSLESDEPMAPSGKAGAKTGSAGGKP